MTYSAFFGYSSKPELARETLHRASGLISRLGISARSWEDLSIGGQVIISSVLAAIDEASVSIFDVSTLHPNVLSSLATLWASTTCLALDRSDRRGGCSALVPFPSSLGSRIPQLDQLEDIRDAYLLDQPHLAENTVYDQLIEPTLVDEPRGAAIFYMPLSYDTDASIAVDRRLAIEARQGVRLITADPNESALNPLSWYAQKVNESAATVVHFAAERRTLAHLRNARAALISGLATGLERPALMLAEEDYSPPLDYQDRLKHYSSTEQCSQFIDTWLLEQQIGPMSATVRGGFSSLHNSVG